MPGKTRKLSVQEKLKLNIQFLDALLAELQNTSSTAAVSTSKPNGRQSPELPPPPVPPPPSFEAMEKDRPDTNDATPQTQQSSSLGANLSELDSLLEGLNNPLLFSVSSEPLHVGKQATVETVSHAKPVSNGNLPNIQSPKNEFVNDLDSPQSPKHQVTTTHYSPPAPIRAETHPGPSLNGVGGQQMRASTATRELDDLMASLSDFKVNVGASGSPGQVRRSSDYAKPQPKVTKTPSSGGQVGQVGKVSQLDSMLGSLQSDMSRQGVSTTKKGTCAACNKPIIGQVCTALGRTWHPEHFNCVACEIPLGTRNFFERDGKPYCEKDYHDTFAPRCAYCNGAILDSCVTALDQTWHPDHFVCTECGKPFGDTGFHERDGKPFCREDYYAMFAPRCGGCGQPIMDNYISALSAHWHQECFICNECRQPFPGGSFFEHDSRPYCEMHYHAKRGTLCYSCQKPITGRCITAMHRKFHPEHFVCAFCLKQLNKGTFKEQNDKPYCHPCFVKLFG